MDAIDFGLLFFRDGEAGGGDFFLGEARPASQQARDAPRADHQCVAFHARQHQEAGDEKQQRIHKDDDGAEQVIAGHMRAHARTERAGKQVGQQRGGVCPGDGYRPDQQNIQQQNRAQKAHDRDMFPHVPPLFVCVSSPCFYDAPIPAGPGGGAKMIIAKNAAYNLKTDGTSLPGLRMLRGSNACLSARIASSSSLDL
jgi:hypothetical protein